jgi:hypothetical protein
MLVALCRNRMQDPSADLSDDDPLLGFSTEVQPVEPHLSESKADHAHGAQDASIATNDSVIGRVAELERQLERALIEVANLRSDVATLVGAISDIRKGQAGRPQPPSRPSTGRPLPRRTTALATIVVAVMGLAAWGLLSLASYDVAEPPPIETADTSPASESITPVAAAHTPPIELQTVAAVSTIIPERNAPVPLPPTKMPARAVAPPQDQAVPRAGGYVGTLSIDASPPGDVFLNRKNIGRTPVRLEGLRAGSHLVWIEREGYRRWTRVVAVAANRVSRVSAELDPIAR